MHPGTYRGVSVTRVDCALDETALREHFVGRSAYFKTRFAVVQSGGADVCILRIHTLGGADTADDTELFVPIAGVTMLAAPGETAMVRAPDVDTGIPTQLACAARDLAPGRRAVVVHGRFASATAVFEGDLVEVKHSDEYVAVNDERLAEADDLAAACQAAGS